MTHAHASRWYLAVVTGILLCTLPSMAAADKVRIIQTNSAGDNVHIIDPATNKVVGVIEGIEVNHGAAVAPDGSRIYISNEAESTLDVVDAKTLKVTSRHPAERPPQQHRRRQGRAAGLCRDHPGARRRRRHRHRVAEEREDAADQGQHPQRVRHARTASTSSPAPSPERRSTCSTRRRKSRRGRSTWIWASVR